VSEFVPTRETADLRAAVKDHCGRTWHEQAVRAVAEEGKSITDAWRALGGQLGVLGLTVPEKWGGGGAGVVETAVVAEELGATLAPVPYLSAAYAARLLTGSGEDEACAELLPGLCSGERIFAVAQSTSDYGVVGQVVDAPHATDLLVIVGDVLFHVDTAGVTLDPVPTLDLTRPQADVHLDGARRIGRADPAASDVVVTLLAAELVGVARAMLDVAVSYAKERLQFGRPIGSFQAVKQRCADMLIEVELARSVAEHAAWTLDHGDDPSGDDPALAASLAHVVTAGAARTVTGDAIQVLGGVGFTWEHQAHLYYKRAVSAGALWGGRGHRDRLAALAINEGSSHVR
jgi:alkylation response protein AidB-like acyl-CoA dehydrogenase